MPSIRVVMLGAFRVQVDGEPVPDAAWRRRKARQLFKLLVGRTDRRLLKDEAIELLWPESEPTAASTNLRTTVRSLRLALGRYSSQLIVETAEAYGLHPTAEVSTDVDEFEKTLAEAATAADPLPLLERAHALYGGDYLPDDLYEDFASAPREHLKRTWSELQHTLARHWQERDEPERALQALERLVRADPCDERAVHELMRLLGQLGRRLEALRVYQRLVEALRAELDVEPTALTRQLYTELSSGHDAAPPPRPQLPTGTLTFLFTDIKGSTYAWLRDPKAMSAALVRHDVLIEQQVSQHGGHLVRPRGEGDSRFAVFVRASDAVAAACAIQIALHDEPWSLSEPLRVRMAVHTGESDLRAGDYYGPAVNHCARLRAVGHAGQVLVSTVTANLVRESLSPELSLWDLGDHQLKDLQRPERIWQLVHPHLPGDFPPLTSLARHNLPEQLSSFVGREQQIAELRDLLGRSRLLTLTGPGGIGKTRLATQVADLVIADYADGVWLVRLEALTDPALVPAAIASVLGVREQPGRSLLETLCDTIRAQHLLLVLDNCEHVVSATAEVVQALVERCPQLHIIATSREALNVAGERSWRVPSLSLPSADDTAADQRGDNSEAVRLFVERAMLARPGFALTSQNAAAVAQICRRLDGIPLAIELAAVRVKTLSAEHLTKRLEGSFNLLTGGSRTAMPRHQTLQAAIDWSYDRLSSADQVFLQRLAVFSGTWTLEAAEAVCSGSGIDAEDALDRLTALVDRSLVSVEEHGGIEAYRLLEPIRRYALEHLVESGDSEALNRRLAEYITDLAEGGQTELPWGPRRGYWLDRLEQEHDSLRTALAWAVGHDLPLALRLALAAWGLWEGRWYLREGRSWLEQVVDLSAGYEALASLRVKAMCVLASLLRLQGDREHTAARVGEILGQSRVLGYGWGEAFALNGLGLMAMESEDLPAAARYFEESETLWRIVDDKVERSYALTNLALAVEFQGEQDRARSLLEESLTLRRELGDNDGALPTLIALARLTRERQDREGALGLFRQILTLARPLRRNRGTVLVLDGLASLAMHDGKSIVAVRLLAAARSLQKESDYRPPRHEPSDRQRTTAAARASLDEREFAAAWAEGEALTPEDAVSAALAVLDPRTSISGPEPTPAPD